MNWRYPSGILTDRSAQLTHVGFLDPFDGSTGLADGRRVYVLVKIAAEVAALTARGYGYQEPQCGAEP